MNRREQLQENCEEALFTLLIEDVMEEEGKKLIEENERLKNDPQAAVPVKIRKRCLKTIRREFNKGKRQKVGKVAYQAVSKIAVVSMLCILLFSAAFAANPKLRTKTLNLMIEISEVGTNLILGENKKSHNIMDNSEVGELVYSTFGYRIPNLPDGFSLTTQKNNFSTIILVYTSADGRIICFEFHDTTGGGVMVDTENAQRVESVLVNGFDGMLIEKENRIHIVWADSNRGALIGISGVDVGETTIWSLASSIR